MKESDKGLQTYSVKTDALALLRLETGLNHVKAHKGRKFLHMIEQYGRNEVVGIMAGIVTKNLEHITVKQTPTDQGIILYCNDHITTFPTDTMEDFILFFRKLRTGEFGDIWRVDAVVLFDLYRKYVNTKMIDVEYLHRETEEYKGETNWDLANEWLEKIKSQLRKPEKPRYNTPTDSFEKMVQRIKDSLPDMTEEEIQEKITWCNSFVNSIAIDELIEILKDELDKRT